jgi:hypothetical protein
MTWQERELRNVLVKPLMLLLILIPVGIFAGGLQQLNALFCPVPKCSETVRLGWGERCTAL